MLQKLAYLAVIFILLPLVMLMGFAMSPRLDTLYPGWVDLFGGRQSARTIHFILAWLLVAFVLDPRLRGHRQRLLEPPSLHDHRALPGRCGGKR